MKSAVKSTAESSVSSSRGSMSTPQKLLATVLAVLLHLPLFWHLQEGLQRGDSSISNASQSGVALKLAARPAAKPVAPVPAPPSEAKVPTPPPPPTAKPKPVLTPSPAAEEIDPQPAVSNWESSDAQEEKDGSQQEQQVIGGQTMGLGGTSDSGENDDELERYKGLIHSRIKQLHQYPQQARMRNQQGTVEITFDVADDGSIASFSISRSSGSPLLDRAAERLFSRLKLPPPDTAILPSLAGLTVPVKFELESM